MPHCGGLKNLSGTVGSTTLTVEQLASHTHTVHGNSDGGWSGSAPTIGDGWQWSRKVDATGGSQPHTHTLSGESGEADGLPPYYALSFIMRTA